MKPALPFDKPGLVRAAAAPVRGTGHALTRGNDDAFHTEQFCHGNGVGQVAELQLAAVVPAPEVVVLTADNADAFVRQN